MLVLTRRSSEEIVIDDVIRVRVVDIRGDKVRLGITAPDDMVIVRKELLDNDNLEAAQAA